MMKIKKIFLLFGFFFAIIIAANAQTDRLVGTWQNEQYKVSYTFRKDGSVIFDQGVTSTFVNSYSLDESKTPIWLDFKIAQGGASMMIPALIEFIDENTIKIEQFPPYGEHPVEFSKDDGNGIVSRHVLKKVLN